MAKAILVIDMPNRCDECLLCNDYGNYIECKKAERQLLTYDKPDWCPLKPLEEFELVRDELKKRMEHPERYAQR